MQRESHRPLFPAPLGRPPAPPTAAPAGGMAAGGMAFGAVGGMAAGGPQVADPVIRAGMELPPPPPRVPANDPAGGVPRKPFAGRPARPASDARVLPLGAFHWGGLARRGGGTARAAQGATGIRARGDHCLLRVAAGSIRVTLASGGIDCGAGAIVFVPAGTAFAAVPRDGAAGQVLLIPRAAAAELPLPLPGRVVTGTEDGPGAGLSAQLADLARQAADPVAAATAGSRLAIVSAALNRLASAPGRGIAAPDAGAVAAARPDRALVTDYLDLAGREMGRGRTTADLAQALGTTAAALDAACRRQRGQSALDLLYGLRLERARSMIAAGAPEDRIALELGFTGTAHLHRAFVAATGRPAAAFRAETP